MVSYEVLTLILIFNTLCYDTFNDITNKCCMLYMGTFVKLSDNEYLLVLLTSMYYRPTRTLLPTLINKIIINQHSQVYLCLTNIAF